MRAQVSIEFMYMIMAATMMIILFTVIFSEIYQDNLRDKKAIIFEDFGYSIQTEVIMAAEAKPGYMRNFTVPEKLEGFGYEITILNSTLLINYTDNIFEIPIPKTSGNLKKGLNTIINENNSIILR